MTDQFDDALLKKALGKQNLNHDPKKMDAAVGAAMRVFAEQNAQNTAKLQKEGKTEGGFPAFIRQLFHRTTEKADTMQTSLKKKLMYGAPVLAGVAVLALIGIDQMQNNPYLGLSQNMSQNKDHLGFEAMDSIGWGGPSAPEVAAASQAPAYEPLQEFKPSTPKSEAMRKIAPMAAPMSAPLADAAMAGAPPAPPVYNNAVAPQAEMRARMQMNSMVRPEPISPPQDYYDKNDYYERYPGGTVSSSAQFANAPEQELVDVAKQPVSTFSMDVDTASYSFVRKMLNDGQLPPADSVRVEEMVNYFHYDYAKPASKDKPIATTIGIYPSPWHAQAKIIHVGLQAYKQDVGTRPRANLVFLVDVSGSMGPADRLPLLQNALTSFVDQLRDDDMVAIVTYANGSGIALPPTSARDKNTIKQALLNLRSGGGTAGAQGLQTAYALAEKAYDTKSTTRVILATDGDFNVGISDPNQLQKFVENKREKGVYLTILGVGTNNINDTLMQRLAQYGNGTAAYLDNLNEAQRVLGEQLDSGMVPVANDVKAQVEFNPRKIASYRLIGYETRALNREDFNNDRVDAGDVGAGQQVTALYEVMPVGATPATDPLRYGAAERKPAVMEDASTFNGDEYAFLKLRYKTPGEKTSKLMTESITPEKEVKSVSELSTDMRFAASVAGFAQLLRNGVYAQSFGYDDLLKVADGAIGKDPNGLRKEFVTLVRAARNAAGTVDGFSPNDGLNERPELRNNTDQIDWHRGNQPVTAPVE